MSGPAQPVMVFTMNYISMKMDMKEGIRLHFVSKKEERRQMGVSQRPADRHTKCFWGGGLFRDGNSVHRGGAGG